MAYKVLLADDSVPAQNMGKKILIDAGYDVLTVSNGLEALRKIAEHHAGHCDSRHLYARIHGAGDLRTSARQSRHGRHFRSS